MRQVEGGRETDGERERARDRDGDEGGDGLMCVCQISNNHVRWPVTVATLALRLLREVAPKPFTPEVRVIL